MTTKTTFEPGDIVRHKATFLRNVGWFTDVPKNGKVTEVGKHFITVHWCDREEPTPVLACNIEKVHRRFWNALPR